MDNHRYILAYNCHAWDRQVERGNRWTVPVGPDEVFRARNGDWNVVLTPTKAVAPDWFPPMSSLDVLCLASGGRSSQPPGPTSPSTTTVPGNSPGIDSSLTGRD